MRWARTHARDELGITSALSARPIQAAVSSAASFAVGALMPLVTALVAPDTAVVPAVILASLLLLAITGALAARVGGSSVMRGVLRVTFWGALAMAVTAGVGALFGSTV